jgi:hypothetical protein
VCVAREFGRHSPGSAPRQQQQQQAQKQGNAAAAAAAAAAAPAGDPAAPDPTALLADLAVLDHTGVPGVVLAGRPRWSQHTDARSAGARAALWATHARACTQHCGRLKSGFLRSVHATSRTARTHTHTHTQMCWWACTARSCPTRCSCLPARRWSSCARMAS